MSESRLQFLRRLWKSPFPGTVGSVISTEPIPDEDVARAAELARERGWKDRP